MKIQMVDLQSQYKRIKTEIDNAISEVLETTAFINGPAVEQFSKELAAYNQVKHVVPCANGTDALQLAMMGLGLKPGDEVLVPAFTYVATAEVIALLGLTPVFVDVYADTFLIDVEKLKQGISAKTKAIVPVHLFGQCADMESIMSIAVANDLFVIEDTAQALGAEFTFSNGITKKAGTIGDIGTTSFFPSKNLGCYGDGGALLVNDHELALKIKMIANHGQRVKYHHDIIGVNSRLDTLQAAILSVKLPLLNDFTKKRNETAALYDAALAGYKSLSSPVRAKNSSHVFHQYTIKCIGFDREELSLFLKQKGIPTMVYYPVPLHFQKAYKHYKYDANALSTSEQLSNQVLSLPIHTEQDNEQVLFIAEQIKSFITQKDLE